MEHFSRSELRPGAPAPARKVALSMRLAMKRDALSSAPASELGTPSNPHIVGDDDEDGVPHEKGRQ